MKHYYGATNEKNINTAILIACSELSIKTIPQAVAMVEGTFCAETNFGKSKDGYFSEGAGLPQFDTVRYKDVFKYICTHSSLINIFEDNGFDLEGLYSLPDYGYSILNYSPLFSAFVCRAAYMMIPEPLPPQFDYQAQAEYWKKYWNSEAGAGTPEHYMRQLRNHKNI